MSSRPPEHDRAAARKAAERERWTTNLVLLLIVAALIGIGVWLADALIAAKRADDCIAQGRRNCAPIEAPPR
ncbi:MAG: hypothetical protein IT536_09735 [Hyphomicrobiales bacterium]|nr:hypothetical protein [Hyphomicrobiales bacterium]